MSLDQLPKLTVAQCPPPYVVKICSGGWGRTPHIARASDCVSLTSLKAETELVDDLMTYLTMHLKCPGRTHHL